MLSDVSSIKENDGEWNKVEFVAALREIFDADEDWARLTLDEITQYVCDHVF
jgi:hypothetical protein